MDSSKFKNILEVVNDETLAKITTAVVAGLAATAVGHKIYKKYKEKKLLNKYGGMQEKEKEEDHKVDPIDAGWNALDAYAARQLVRK